MTILNDFFNNSWNLIWTLSAIVNLFAIIQLIRKDIPTNKKNKYKLIIMLTGILCALFYFLNKM